jgi:diguanylate cyclase (GGDEF)-like protein
MTTATHPETGTSAAVSLSLKALDALAMSLAAVDGAGRIVFVNEGWRRFGRANGARALDDVGTSYLAICDRAAAAGEATAGAVGGSLRALLAGERESFSLCYPCHSPGEERWFEVTGTAFADGGSRYALLAHQDVTARERVDAALKAREQMLKQILEVLPVGVWTMDAAGTIVHANPAGLKIWAGARFVGPDEFGEYKGWWLETGEPIAADEWAAARAIRRGETSIDEEIEIECFDGSRKIILNSALPLRGPEGEIVGAIIVNQDVTEGKQIEAALRDGEQRLLRALDEQATLARTDFLTGVHARRHFFELAAHELAVAQRYRQPSSLLLFDIDRFKKVNDRYGHDVGDRVLKHVAEVASRTLRQSDVLARHGGEEFAVLLPQTDVRAALVVAEHLRSAIAESTLATEHGSIGVTVSVGAAAARDGDSVDDVVRRADQALYAAKSAGRNRSMMAADPGA